MAYARLKKVQLVCTVDSIHWVWNYDRILDETRLYSKSFFVKKKDYTRSRKQYMYVHIFGSY